MQVYEDNIIFWKKKTEKRKKVYCLQYQKGNIYVYLKYLCDIFLKQN